MAKINGIKCKDCKSENVFILDKGQHKGIYCEDCGAWIKWSSKKEYNLYKISKVKELKQNEMQK